MQTQAHTITTPRGAGFAGFGRLLTVLTLLTAGAAQANNIAVTNVAWKTTGSTVESSVQFDLAWDNSWRAAWTEAAATNVTDAELPVENWDAAWVFVKFRKAGTTSNGYTHATLSTNAADHAMPTGATNIVGLTDDGQKGVGVFIYRNAVGHGANAFKQVKLRWLHASNEVVKTDTVNLQVHAIEMVYVGNGAFNVGGGGGAEAFTSTVITNSNPTQTGGYPTGQIPPDNATWPNGYNVFYCMKYEITQNQYVRFLNTLTYTQQFVRTAISPASDVGTYAENASRHVIKINTSGIDPGTPAVYETAAPYVACNFLSWADGCAYAAWAGLRPMTELEYEKACRGPLNPVSGEFAWGSASIASVAYTLNNSNAADETIATGYSLAAGNAMYTITKGTIGGPVRAGIFATVTSTGTIGRVVSGASYWGIMELSGNLWERPVTIGNTTGRNFQGTHGAGTVTLPVNWPQNDANGAGLRGGYWQNTSLFARTSDRHSAAVVDAGRYSHPGWRGGRSAPSGVGP